MPLATSTRIPHTAADRPAATDAAARACPRATSATRCHTK
jgi:hypothetical protein